MSAAEYYTPEHSRHHHGSTVSSVYNAPVIVDERSRDPNELALVETHRDRRAVSTDRRHHHHHHHQRRDSRDESDTESEFSRTRSRSVDGYEEATKSSRREEAAKAALAAAAVEAWRSRKEPGGITGKQALTRAATAAVASGAIDYIIDRKKGPHESSKAHIAESVVGGLLAQRVLQGHARDDGGSHGGSLGGLGELVALGAAALGGDKLINHEAKKHRSRSGSSGSRDSRRSSQDSRRDSRRDSRGSSRHSHHRRSSSSKRYYDD